MTANVALLGYGLAGSVFHAPFISRAPGLRLSVVVTGNEERREQVSREHPGVEIVGTAAEVWERAAELDLAVIATPNRSHLPLGLAALEAGLALVVDKPLAVNSGEARSLVHRSGA
jgi:predicted dehydrogenase